MKVRRLVLRTAAMSMALAFALSGASAVFADSVALPLTVNAAGKMFSVPDAKAINVADYVNNTIAPAVDQEAVNATRKVNAKKRRFDFTEPVNGVTLDRANSILAFQMMIEAHQSDVDTPTAQSLILPASIVAPKVTGFGKVIMVVLKERRIYLYDGKSVYKKYRCAIGMARYPTPTGTFVIKRKVKMPSWTNPGGAWGKGMPSYIAPGPRNPLGTRALYLYRNGSDTGIRFHGTSNRGSIGHAASHGCMRMRREDVEKFYKQVPIGTNVYVVK